MTETHHSSDSSDSDPLVTVTPSTAEGRSRLLLFVGLGCFAVGHMLDSSLAVWGSLAVVTVAFALNTAGKLVHYYRLPVSRSARLQLSVSWVALAVTIVALLGTYALARYGSGDGAFFWSLALAGFGFGLLHMAIQSRCLDSVDRPK